METIRTENKLEFGHETNAVMEKLRFIFVAGRASDGEIQSKSVGEW